MDAADNADAVGRIGRYVNDVGMGRLDRANDRGEISRVRRIIAVVDDLQPGLFQVDAGAVGGIAGGFAVIDREGNRLKPELVLLGFDDVEEALGDRRARIGSHRQHREVFRVLKLLVYVEREQPNEIHVVGDHNRHRRRRNIGCIPRNDEVDFVDIEQLCIDAGDQRRVALIVVEIELDRAAEQPAFFVGVVGPDLHRQQCRGAVDREAAGQRHAEADHDRLAGRFGGGCGPKTVSITITAASAAIGRKPFSRGVRGSSEQHAFPLDELRCVAVATGAAPRIRSFGRPMRNPEFAGAGLRGGVLATGRSAASRQIAAAPRPRRARQPRSLASQRCRR